MSQPNEQACVLCIVNATFTTVNFGRGKLFTCSKCGSFVITGAAEKKLSSAPKEWRDKLSAEARALEDGMILRIFVPQIPVTGSNGYNALDYEIIEASYE